MKKVTALIEAKAAGLKRYFTGEPCKHGHVCERYTKSGICVECSAQNRRQWGREHPDKVRAGLREWYWSDPERARAASRAWGVANPERKRALAKAWAKANPEKIRIISRKKYYADHAQNLARGRAYREKHAEKTRAYSRAHHAAHPDQRVAIEARRRARKLSAGGSFSPSDVAAKLKAQKRKCAYCRTVLRGRAYHVDHIKPLARGGDNRPSNIQILCQKCNNRKAAKLPETFAREMGLLL